MKAKIILVALLVLSACYHNTSDSYNDDGICPQVQIARNTSYLTQYVKYKETFQISIIGYEGRCYYEDSVDRYQAIIKPTFKIKRLTPSEETDVRFSYYTETYKLPTEDLGKKTYYLNAHIPQDKLEIEYQAPEVKVYIPTEKGTEYDVRLGLWQSPEEKLYNQRTFDINYRYINQ